MLALVEDNENQRKQHKNDGDKCHRNDRNYDSGRLRQCGCSWSCVCQQAHCLNLRSEEHTSELQSPCNLVCRLLLEKKHKRLLTLQIIQVHRTGHGIGRHIDDPCWGTSAHGIHEQIGEEKGREMINGQIHLYRIDTQLALLHMSTRVVH